MTRSDLFCPYGNIDCGDPGSPYMAQCQLCDAADEIKQLRVDLLMKNRRIGELADHIEELQEEINDLRLQVVALSIPKEARRG